MNLHRRIRGITCFQVLELLPDFLEDRLDPNVIALLRAHLAECSECERFGGEYAAAAAALRTALEVPPPPPPQARAALRTRLRRERATG